MEIRFGICNLSIIPVRKQPSERSEMVTQIIFGELYEIIEKQKDWMNVRLAYDDYEGWISANQLQQITTETFNLLNKFPLDTSAELTSEIFNKLKNEKLNIPLGSSLPNLRHNIIVIDDQEYLMLGDINTAANKINRKQIGNTAILYLNAPYLWGGRTPFGIDCSGFTQMVFKINGIKLPRDAADQSLQGTSVSFISEAQIGDLAFFDNEEEEIIHVGIILDNNKIIHSSGKVRIDKIDHYGIFNSDTKKYSHKLRLIKSYVS